MHLKHNQTFKDAFPVNQPEQPKILLLSVGGSPAPLIYTLQEHTPDKIIFFTSPGSRHIVLESILPKLLTKNGLPDHEFVVTENEEDIGVSTFTLLKDVPEALRRLGIKDLDWPNIIDYTGGTKTMSAAVVWASSRYPCKLSYIGSDTPQNRTKGGLGTVLDGRERCLVVENPWNKVAFFEIRAALQLFNRAQYGNAAQLLQTIQAQVDDSRVKRVFTVLGEVFKGYHDWDVFDHRAAETAIRKSLNPLNDLADDKNVPINGLKNFAEETKCLSEVLKGVKQDTANYSKILDLLANAHRRAFLERKYEDAAARCYSAIEKTAQHRLMRYSINTSKADPAQIPDELREEFVRRYLVKKHDGTEALKFGLVASYRLLFVLGDELGCRYNEKESDITNHLAVRNQGILAHGEQPIVEEGFKDLFEDALYLLDRKPDDLAMFPKFSL